MSKVRIVCVGSNLEASIVLRGLVEKGAGITALVTRPQGDDRGISDYVDLTGFCRNEGISLVETCDINSPSTLSQIAQLDPDYIYVLGWSQLFRAELIKLPTKYIVGSHPTPLPLGRGRAPVPWTILSNWGRSAVSLFRLDAEVDSGRLLMQRWFDIPARPYAHDVYQLVAENLRDAFCDLYRAHVTGTVVEEFDQDREKASFFAKRTPADGHLDFHRPAAEIDAVVRAVSHPYPGAYSYYGGEKITVWRSDTDDVPAYVGTVGQILTIDGGRLLVQAGDHPVWIYDLCASGKPVDVSVFRVGRKFGYNIEDEVHRLSLEVKKLKGECSLDRF